MRYAIIESGAVANVAVSDEPLADNWIASETAETGDCYDGAMFSRPVPPLKSPDELQSEIVSAVQQRLDDFARTRNYDGILSAATYAGSSVAQFRAEGAYALERRDATWSRLYEILAAVQSGARSVPSGYSDIEADLPALEWPA